MPRGVPRIPEPWEWVKTKTCKACGQPRPWAKFSPRSYWPDGTVRVVAPACHSCESKRRAAAPIPPHRIESVRAYKRDWLRRKRAALRRERTNHTDMLPREPFVSWLNARIADIGITEVAEIAGVPPRSLHRVVTGESKNVSLSIVDRVLVAFGEHVDNFYPLEQAA